MEPSIDIHMPVRAGGAIDFRVLRALVAQDVSVRLFVDAGPDLELTGAIDELIDLIAFDDEEVARVRLRLRAGVKRSRLMQHGTAAYVYLADPDVLLPSNPRLFRGLVEGLETEPSLGAIGLAYFRNDESHIGAGSMLLRRSDYQSIGRIRGAGRYCNCDFIVRELKLRHMRVEIAAGDIARHLRDEEAPEREGPHAELRMSAEGELELDRLREIVGRSEDGLLLPKPG